MKFTITCKKVSMNDSIKEYAEKKVSKLDRYFREDADALVTFSVEKNHRAVVEITIVSGGTLFRAQEDSRDGDLRGAIDAACATIDRQIRKNKTRLAKRLRQEALVPSVPAEYDVSEETEFQVVRTKHIAVKPMSEEEAILQMNLLGHAAGTAATACWRPTAWRRSKSFHPPYLNDPQEAELRLRLFFRRLSCILRGNALQ